MTLPPGGPGGEGDWSLAGAARLWGRTGAVGRVPVEGQSMLPVLAAGDTVRVRAGAPARCGDIVVARLEDRLLVHRVIGGGPGLVQLRGDNAATRDEALSPAAILGRVTAVEPAEGLSRRFDAPGARALAVATAGWARVQGVIGRGPRAKHLPALARRVEEWALPPLDPEDEFVVLTSRVLVSDRAAARARGLIAAGLDWDAVVARAWRGQLGPLMYAGVRQLGAAGVPPGAHDRLRSMYVGSWARSRKLRALLEETLGLLQAQGIAVLGHKGVALTATVYSDPALHLCGDIDLSVADADRRRAEEATHAVRQALAAAFPTRREADAYHIELDGTAHHDLEPSLFGAGRWLTRALDWEAIWRRARPVAVGDGHMLVPWPADLLLTLVTNALRRGFTPVRLVADIAATIGHFGAAIDWRHFGAVASATRLDRRSWVALGLAADWFDAPVPAHLLEPPPGFRPAAYEAWLLEAKRRRPFARLPTRVLWAGSLPRAAMVAARLLVARPGAAVRIPMPPAP